MAAAEYYNPGGQHNLGPPRPQFAPHSQGNPNPPYPMSDAPPPYSEFAQHPPRPFAGQRPHSQPPPQQRPPMQGPSYTQPPPNQNTHAYPPDKSGRQPSGLHNMYRPSDFNGQYPPQQSYQQYPPPQGYAPLAGTTAMQQVYGNSNPSGRRPSTTPGLRPPRQTSRSRSRSKSRSRHHKHSHQHQHPHRPQVQRKKSSGVNTFLGAGGGALIGDAIFPGLGTLSGAILGGLGGHEYGKKRAHSNPNRARERSYSNDDSYATDEYRRGRRY